MTAFCTHVVRAELVTERGAPVDVVQKSKEPNVWQLKKQLNS